MVMTHCKRTESMGPHRTMQHACVHTVSQKKCSPCSRERGGLGSTSLPSKSSKSIHSSSSQQAPAQYGNCAQSHIGTWSKASDGWIQLLHVPPGRAYHKDHTNRRRRSNHSGECESNGNRSERVLHLREPRSHCKFHLHQSTTRHDPIAILCKRKSQAIRGISWPNATSQMGTTNDRGCGNHPW
jgi:hypothetical protein